MKDYDIGIVETTSTENGTNIIFLDSKLNEVNKIMYPFGSMGGCGFYVPKIVNKIMYENPLGFGVDKDFGTIIGLDLESGSILKYKFGRVNITNYIVNNEYIYVISNLNKITYIDRYSFHDKSIKTIKMNNISALDMAISGKKVYVFANEIDKYSMYEVDIDKQETKAIYDISKWFLEKNDTNYSLTYNNNIYLVSGDKLLIYSIVNNSMTEFQLPYKNGWQLMQKDNKLFISCTDIFNLSKDNAMLIFNMDDNKIINQFNIPHMIKQFEIKDNHIYILGDENILYKYKLDDNSQCKLECKIQIPKNSGFYIGDFFVK